MMPKNRARRRRDDIRLVGRIAAIVLAIEVPVVMMGAALPVHYWTMSFIDGALLVFVCAPIIYFCVVRPYVLERDDAERSAEQSADELRARNEQFDAALQNMQHGLAMFDAQQRLIVCNELYAQMFGLSPEEVKPGTTLTQIVDARIKRGLFAFGSPEEYRRVLIGEEKGRGSTIHQLSDGRWIAAGREPCRRRMGRDQSGCHRPPALSRTDRVHGAP
jgi:PAS domain S-box-containing protein